MIKNDIFDREKQAESLRSILYNKTCFLSDYRVISPNYHQIINMNSFLTDSYIFYNSIKDMKNR